MLFSKFFSTIFDSLGISNKLSQRLNVINSIEDNLQINFEYLILLIGSGIVATLGLLTDNVVFIMGSMLMAPLYWPVIGLALGIASGEKKILKKSFFMICLSTLIVLVFSGLISMLFPNSQITGEIIDRANPTLFDLVVALITSIIGVLAICNPDISFSAAGVALSLSILPPLSNAGIGLTFMNDKILFGSLRMYLTNIVAVVFSSSIFFYLLKFRPNNDDEKKRFSLGVSGTTLLLVAFAIIFSLELFQGITKSTLTNELSKTFISELTAAYPKIVIDDLKIHISTNQSKTDAEIGSTLLLPEGTYISSIDQNDLTLKLARMVSGDVKMKLNVINTTVSELREQEKNEKLLYEEYQKEVQTIVARECPSSTIIYLDIISLENDQQIMRIVLLTPPEQECNDSLIGMIQDSFKNTRKELEIELQLIESKEF